MLALLLPSIFFLYPTALCAPTLGVCSKYLLLSIHLGGVFDTLKPGDLIFWKKMQRMTCFEFQSIGAYQVPTETYVASGNVAICTSRTDFKLIKIKERSNEATTEKTTKGNADKGGFFSVKSCRLRITLHTCIVCHLEGVSCPRFELCEPLNHL